MIFHIFTCILHHSEYVTNSQCDQLPDGLTAQLEEGCTGLVEVMGLIRSSFRIWQPLGVSITAMINHVSRSNCNIDTHNIDHYFSFPSIKIFLCHFKAMKRPFVTTLLPKFNESGVPRPYNVPALPTYYPDRILWSKKEGLHYVFLSNSLRVQSNVDTDDKFETFHCYVYLTENNHDFRVCVFPRSSSLDRVPAKHGEFFTCGKVTYIPSLII